MDNALECAATWDFPLCPTPPGWAVAWEAIQGRFAWVRALAGVPQDAAYHAEGDVLTHTHLVAEALAGLDEWRGLEAPARAALFAAALLHDVAKPACTTVESDGRITSPRHARLGATMARHLLWMGEEFSEPIPFPWREIVARLVRHHGLPLWFLDKPNPARAVIAASQSARLDWVALLAEADVRGRRCTDQQELLDRIALFRVFCEENACYSSPRAFASDHSRYVYFRDPRADPAYVAYDDTTFEVTLLSGLPGVGKDTWLAAHRVGLPVVSLDVIRRELKVAPNAHQGAVIQAAKTRARELLRHQRPFAWNATNVTRALRGQLIDFFAAYHARTRLVYLDAPYDVLLSRNRGREHPVPEHILHKLLRKLEVPDATEAHAVEWILT